jgi:predicted GNAT superfamily acetyltransferase
VTRYYPDFYGALIDDVNAGDESDRCLVTWRLDDARAIAASAGTVEALDVNLLRARGATDVLDEGLRREPIERPGNAPTLICRLPRDIVKLRAADPGLARSWRVALRSVLAPALNDGYEITGVSRDSCYVLARR